VGIVMTSVDEMDSVAFSWLGLWLTLLGVLLSAAKGIITNVLMVGPLKLHPLEVIWRMAPPSCLQCVGYGLALGEVAGLGRWLHQTLPQNNLSPTGCILSLLLNGVLAFLLNWVSFTANKKTSALSMTVAGNVKQTLSILLAIYIFNTPVTALSALGILVTIAGAAWYSWLSLQEKQARGVKAMHSSLPQTMPQV